MFKGSAGDKPTELVLGGTPQLFMVGNTLCPGSLRLNKVKSLFKNQSLAWKTEL